MNADGVCNARTQSPNSYCRMDPFRGLVGFRPRNGGMAEWRNVGMAEWRNGGMAEWQNSRIAECRNGGITEWQTELRDGGMAE